MRGHGVVPIRFSNSRGRHCEERSERSNPFFLSAARWIASRSLSSGARSRDPLARNDDPKRGSTIPRRDAPELHRNHSPQQEEGAGNAGCALHPRSRVQDAQRNAHTSIQGQRRHSGIPRAMALRLMPCSPRRRIRLVTVVSGLKVSPNPVGLEKTSANLTPATGARTTRFCRTLQRRSSARRLIAHGKPPCDQFARRRCRVHRIPPRVRDDSRSAPQWVRRAERNH